MNIKRALMIFAVMTALVSAGIPVLAEVSAEVDEQGNYVRMVVLKNASVKNVKLWTVNRQKPNLFPLNPDGDLRGDLWPLISENPVDDNHPWVIWSGFNGHDFDLAWSRWVAGEWLAVRWVEDQYSPQDDLDPDLEFDLQDAGRPYITWWSDYGGTGRIYMSIFLRTKWMRAYLVSDPDVDSRYPVIEFTDDGKIKITYETPSGLETRIIVFSKPNSIYDDLDPMSSLFLEKVNEIPSF